MMFSTTMSHGNERDWLSCAEQRRVRASDIKHREVGPADDPPAAWRVAGVDRRLRAGNTYRTGRDLDARRLEPADRDSRIDRPEIGEPRQKSQHVDAVRGAC